MKILICDDEEQYVHTLTAYIAEYMDNRFIKYDITASTSPEMILSQETTYDLAFLDIEMGKIDGIELAKNLKLRNNKIALFFITNYDSYQDDAMDLQAFRFFSKPFNIVRLYSGLDKAMEYIDGSYVDIYLYGNNTQQRVLIDDIVYITRDGRKSLVKTRHHDLLSHENFDELCDKLPSLFFYMVHKSFFVNLHYVKQYSYAELLMTDGSRIPIASRKQAQFHKYWFEYLRRR